MNSKTRMTLVLATYLSGLLNMQEACSQKLHTCAIDNGIDRTHQGKKPDVEAGNASGTGKKAEAPIGPMTEPNGPIQDIRTMADFQRWYTYYYLYPSPELTVKAIKFAEKNGVFEMQGASVVCAALISQIFAQNPKRLASWMSELSTLATPHKVIVWKSLWQVNTEESKRLANEFAQYFPQNNKPPLLSQFSPRPTPIEGLDLSPAVLDMLWASFSITGDQKYVERIMSALPGLRRNENEKNFGRMITAGAAQWSLTANARQHKRVMAICLAARHSHPEWQPELGMIIEQAKLPAAKSVSTNVTH